MQSVLVYVNVADVDATIARARKLGAVILMDKMEIPGVGWMTIIGDPGGNRIAAMQRMQPPAE
jgi:predicted enzyme related to lactoylglutathione lyase